MMTDYARERARRVVICDENTDIANICAIKHNISRTDHQQLLSLSPLLFDFCSRTRAEAEE